MTEDINYQRVFRSLPDTDVLLSSDLVVIDATDVYLESTSKQRDKIVGKGLFDNFPESEGSEGAERLQKNIKLAISTGKTQVFPTFRYDILDKNGNMEKRFWRTISVPIRYNENRIYVLHRLSDVSGEVSENKAFEMINRGDVFRLLIDNVKDYAIFMLDHHGFIRTWSTAAKKLNLYDASEVIGQHFSIFYSPEDLLSKKPEWELDVAAREGRVEDENWRKRKDGTYFWANVVITAIRDDKKDLLGFAKIVRDLTERKINEENIILAYQESSRLKSEFLSNMSHEIRTPMNGILSATTLLMEQDVDQEQRELLKIVQQSSASLLKLLNDVLDYSKMESDRVYVVYEVFDLYNEIEEIIGNYEALIVKPVKLSLHISDKVSRFVKGDRLRVHQVFSNLVDNAIKFTEEGRVDISVDLVDSDEKTKDYVVQFTIADTGIGISQEDLGKLFSPFSQLDAFSTKKYKGTGLGLAICKRLVEIMRGKIWVTSEMGKGSTFYFTISFKMASQKEDNVQHPKPVASSDKRALFPEAKILIAEDNVINQNVIKRVLKRLGYKNMQVAENGSEALEKISHEKFDIILMDIQMPVMDGYQATKEIRNMKMTIPIVAMTANALKGDAEKCLAAGMDDYISKPVDIQLLGTVMNHWLNRN